MAGLIAAVKCGVCWKTSYNWTPNKLLRMQKRSKTHITSPVVPRGTDGVELSISDNSLVFLFPLLSDLVPWEALLGLCFEVICGNLFRALSVSRACSSSHQFFRPFIVIWTRRSEEWKVFIRIASGVRHRFYLFFFCSVPTHTAILRAFFGSLGSGYFASSRRVFPEECSAREPVYHWFLKEKRFLSPFLFGEYCCTGLCSPGLVC